MVKNSVFFKNLNICSDGSTLVMTYSFNYLKKFEKIKILEKDFKSFQIKYHNQSFSFSNKLSDNKNLYYRQKYFKI